jgi:hypothetical protein
MFEILLAALCGEASISMGCYSAMAPTQQRARRDCSSISANLPKTSSENRSAQVSRSKLLVRALASQRALRRTMGLRETKQAFESLDCSLGRRLEHIATSFDQESIAAPELEPPPIFEERLAHTNVSQTSRSSERQSIACGGTMTRAQ